MSASDYPWENVFNFVMASGLSGALLVVLWVAAIGRGSAELMDLNLVWLTAAWFGFVVPRAMKWMRHAR